MTQTTDAINNTQVVFDHTELVNTSNLSPNPWQPRQHFDRVGMMRLAEDIRRNGLLNPITVRRKPGYNGTGPIYQIAAGERRWRAFQILEGGYHFTGPAEEDAEGDLVPGEAAQEGYPVGITMDMAPDPRFVLIPVIIRDLDDASMMRIALGENQQRSDITAMEEALAFARMLAHLDITQTEFGKRMGISQSLVANRLRMLKLPEAIRHNWITGELSQWHAIKLLEWQNKFNLTLPYFAFLTLAFKKKQIIPSYLDDGPFEDKIAALPGGRELLQNNPLPVQGNLLDEIEGEGALSPAPIPTVTYPVPATAAPIITPARPAPVEEIEEAEEPVTAATPSLAPPAPAPVASPAPIQPQVSLAEAAQAQAQPNIEQAKKDAAAEKFAKQYSNKYLSGPAAPDQPTCRFLARMIVINTYLRMQNPAAYVVRMQSWLRVHNLSDELEPFYPAPLPVAWIDRMLEEFREEFYRNPEVVQAAVALTTECALQTGDFNNSVYQAELYYYIRAALAEAAKKTENEIPEFK
jgi:predicted DNA-binding protein (UPF0251 family)